MSDFQELLSQSIIKERLITVFQNCGKRYRKFQQIHARPAKAGEIVLSITSSGIETKNIARDGDFVVKNLTEALELYIVPGNKFYKRYTLVGEQNNEWKIYRPLGEVFAVEINTGLLTFLEQTSPFLIQAPWGEPQRVELNDFFVTHLDYSEIYRIARQEFFQTYRLAADELAE